MPFLAAAFSICSLPAMPYPSLLDTRPIFVIPFFFITSQIFWAPKLSFWATLKMYFATGFVITSAAAQEMRIIFASSQMVFIFIVSPLVDGPMMAKTLSSSMSCLAKEIAFSGLPAESLTTSSRFLPLTPPFPLISSTIIWAVFASGDPRNEAGPVTAKIAPILMVSPLRFLHEKLKGSSARHITMIQNFFNDIGPPSLTC